jgi:hypothetical protein
VLQSGIAENKASSYFQWFQNRGCLTASKVVKSNPNQYFEESVQIGVISFISVLFRLT